MKRMTIGLAFTAILLVSVQAQEFQNLDFESAYDLPGNPGNGVAVSVTNALPGWAAYDGPVSYSDIYYVSNSFPGYSTVVELEGGSLALSGSFSVGLYSGGSITQTGLVPGNAESIEFEANPALNLEVTLGGQILSYSTLSVGSGYTLYGANIPSDLDAQTETLTFYAQGPGGIAVLDNIEFSTSSVPEPGECGLTGLGLVLFPAFAQKLRRGKGLRPVA